MKRVRVELYNFDALPGHVVVVGSGSASDAKLAAGRAVRAALQDSKLKGRRVRAFTGRFTVSEEVKDAVESNVEKRS